MSSNVIIISGVGACRASGIYRERDSRPTLSMQNLPLGSYTVYLFSVEYGRRLLVAELPFDGRYLKSDQPFRAPARLVAVAEKGRVLAYGTSEGTLPSAGELEASIAAHRRAEEEKRAPVSLLRGEPRFSGADARPVERTSSAESHTNRTAETESAGQCDLGDREDAYAGVTPEDFLLRAVTDPLMREDLQALETEKLLSGPADAPISVPGKEPQTERAGVSAAEADAFGNQPYDAVSGSEYGYMQERSERILSGKNPEKRMDYAREGGRTVILQGNSPLFDGARGETPTYYQTIQREAEQLLKEYEHERFLESFIEESSFVRIPFDAAGHYYVFGVVRESGQPKYLCFAVPEPYRETPPDTLKGFTQFVPRDPMRPYGDGYFMMFQSAVSGRTIPAQE